MSALTELRIARDLLTTAVNAAEEAEQYIAIMEFYPRAVIDAENNIIKAVGELRRGLEKIEPLT